MNLENLRDALSDVDRQIIDLIAERQRIVGEIGQSKLAHGTATRDFARDIGIQFTFPLNSCLRWHSCAQGLTLS